MGTTFTGKRPKTQVRAIAAALPLPQGAKNVLANVTDAMPDVALPSPQTALRKLESMLPAGAPRFSSVLPEVRQVGRGDAAPGSGDTSYRGISNVETVPPKIDGGGYRGFAVTPPSRYE